MDPRTCLPCPSFESIAYGVHHVIDRPKEEFAQGNWPAADELRGYGGEGTGGTKASTAEEESVKPHVKEGGVFFIGYRTVS